MLAALLLWVVPGLPSQDPATERPLPRTRCVELLSGGRSLRAYPLARSPGGPAVFLLEDGTFREVPDPDAASPQPDASVDDLPAEGLVMGLGHENAFVRADCQRLLLLRTHLPPDLAARVLREGRPEVRSTLLEILRQRPLAELAESIRACLFHADETVRASALAAYGVLQPRDLLARCESALFRDHSPRVRHQAVVQMAATGDLEVVDLLLERVGDEEDRNVRVRIYDALRRLLGRSFGRAPEPWIQWWHNHREELLAEREAARG